MCLPINLGTPLLNLSRIVRTFAAEIAENLKGFYCIAREIIGFGHRRSDARYYKRIVEKQYKPKTVVCV